MPNLSGDGCLALFDQRDLGRRSISALGRLTIQRPHSLRAIVTWETTSGGPTNRTKLEGLSQAGNGGYGQPAAGPDGFPVNVS